MDELSSAPPKRVTLAPRLGYEDSPREDAALVLEDAAQSRVTLAPRGEPLKEATEPSTPLARKMFCRREKYSTLEKSSSKTFNVEKSALKNSTLKIFNVEKIKR